MIKKYTYKDLTWIDVFKPTKDEAIQLMEEYSISPDVANNLLIPTFKPSVDLHKNFIYLILHFPALKHTHENKPNQEVDFVIGEKFLITSRYENIDPIHKFSKLFEVNSILGRENIGEKAGDLFFLLLKKIYASIGHEIEEIDDELEKTEDMIFQGEEKQMVKNLSIISRKLLNLKQATNNHKETLDSLAIAGDELFGGDFIDKTKDILNDYQKIRHELEIHRESLIELRDTNDSLLSTKQNETMKVLTIMAFVTFPLSLIASIFGMNTQHMPIIGGPYDFWEVVGIMIILTMCMFLFFKYKKWL